eukprot:TRINITY_DN5260_c0_g1_i2.p1 TRINITY_DN5260_c0_g1~~TRINITY_DN5260_c0_g1_i2.p1  ORF type:complete len:548 (-),score=84.18 TRINITY_DN5260_c0_g1_i2:83-1726(-)
MNNLRKLIDKSSQGGRRAHVLSDGPPVVTPSNSRQLNKSLSPKADGRSRSGSCFRTKPSITGPAENTTTEPDVPSIGRYYENLLRRKANNINNKHVKSQTRFKLSSVNKSSCDVRKMIDEKSPFFISPRRIKISLDRPTKSNTFICSPMRPPLSKNPEMKAPPPDLTSIRSFENDENHDIGNMSKSPSETNTYLSQRKCLHHQRPARYDIDLGDKRRVFICDVCLVELQAASEFRRSNEQTNLKLDPSQPVIEPDRRRKELEAFMGKLEETNNQLRFLISNLENHCREAEEKRKQELQSVESWFRSAEEILQLERMRKLKSIDELWSRSISALGESLTRVRDKLLEMEFIGHDITVNFSEILSPTVEDEPFRLILHQYHLKISSVHSDQTPLVSFPSPPNIHVASNYTDELYSLLDRAIHIEGVSQNALSKRSEFYQESESNVKKAEPVIPGSESKISFNVTNSSRTTSPAGVHLLVGRDTPLNQAGTPRARPETPLRSFCPPASQDKPDSQNASETKQKYLNLLERVAYTQTLHQSFYSNLLKKVK